MEDAEEAERNQDALRRNPALVCVFHASAMSLFPIAILTLFLRDDLALDMADVFLLQAIFGGAVAALEFPGGYVADRIGYRRSLLLGSVLASSGWVVYALARDFLAIAVAELWLAAGFALISGADTALMYESLLAVNEEPTYTRWFARYRSLGNVAEGTAALAGSALYALWPRVPFALQALLWLGNLGIAWRLVEPPRAAGAAGPAASHALSILRYATLDAPRLRAVIGLFLALSLPVYCMIWILPTYARDSGVSAAWMGPIWAASSYVVALGSITAPRIAERIGQLPTLVGCVALVAVGYGGLGLTHAFWGFLFYGALCLVRGVLAPLLLHEEQRLIPSSDRASLLSLKSLGFRLAFCVIGPPIGYALDVAGQHTVLLALAVPFTAVAAAALWALVCARAPAVIPTRL
ncbi:MAG: MFS transporter [Myxococcales bacterium]|jgi:predicted MFS family arabinose efflux permease